MSNTVLGTIRAGLCSQSKDKKDDNQDAPEEIAAAATSTSTTKPGVTAFGLPFTQRVGDKTTGLKNGVKESEANDGSVGSSYKRDVSKTEKDSKNLGNDTPPVDKQSHASVVEKSATNMQRIFQIRCTLKKIAKWHAHYREVFGCELHQWEACDKNCLGA